MIGGWDIVGLVLDLAGAVAAAAVAAGLFGRRRRFGAAGGVIVAALALTAGWSIAAAAAPGYGAGASSAEAVRNIAWFLVLYRLFASDGRHESLAPIRPLLAVLCCVEFLQILVAAMAAREGIAPASGRILFELGVLLHLLATVGALVLVHNLYVGGTGQSRLALRWPATALGAMWAFDLNLYTIAYLQAGWPAELSQLRGLATVAQAVLFAIGAARDREAIRIRPSRAVTFRTFSLLVIGIYLFAMIAVARSLSYLGGDFARLIELGFLTVGSALAILVLPSARVRGWLRVTLAKHLFQHRYDYRAEWMRFTRTIGSRGDDAAPLAGRAIQAVADIAESPAGLLLAPDDNGDLTLAGRWQWPAVEVPAVALPARSIAFFERDGFIVDLDDLRQGIDMQGEAAVIPAWLIDEPRAWALVPLIHFERLVGLVVLARPSLSRRLDWEDFDVLRVVGQQLASYLAEHSGQQALAEAARFDDFHRRIAFVMHDIKNLASQLSLLARNAEKHADNPAFRSDMLLTLRNSSDKLNALLARLSRYGGSAVEKLQEVQAEEVAQAAVARFRGGHPVVLAECQPCTISANPESLEQVLVHLIQNGIDASPANAPVFLSLTSDGLHARFEVVDSGCGMSPDFVRNRLFRPFVSSKPGGFGIGAFEARELVRAMNGRLDVESREGLGSRFAVRLPLASANDILRSFSGSAQKVA